MQFKQVKSQKMPKFWRFIRGDLQGIEGMNLRLKQKQLEVIL